MRFTIDGQEQQLGMQALDHLNKELDALHKKMEPLTLDTMQVETWSGRVERASHAFATWIDGAVELTGPLVTITRTALAVLKAKCEKVAESQTKLAIEPDDTRERIHSIEFLDEKMRGQGSLFSASEQAAYDDSTVTISTDGHEPVTLTGRQLDHMADTLGR